MKSLLRETFLFMPLLKLYRLANLLSLDVVIGALCGALFFEKSFEGRIELSSLIALGSTVWIIYTIDHLLDSRRNVSHTSSRRHQFHHRHRKTISRFLIAVIILTSILLLVVPLRVILQGSMVMLIAAAYLCIQHSLNFSKELVVAAIYTTGLLIPGMSILEIQYHHLFLLAAFALTAFLNLILFSWFDYLHDLKNKSASIVVAFGKPASSVIVVCVFFFISSLTLFSGFKIPFLIVWLIAAVHIIVFLRARYFSINERYRFLCESLFFLPGIYLFF